MVKRLTPIILLSCASLIAAPEDVGITLTASTGIPRGLTKEDWLGDAAETFPKLTYTGTTKNGILNISPALLDTAAQPKPIDYLQLYRSGGPIQPLSFDPSINLSFPAIDVRLVNNGKKAVHFSAATLKVAKSKPDPTPLPRIFGGFDQVQSFDLLNDGWEAIEKLELDFTFSAEEPTGLPPELLPHHRTFRRVKESLKIDLTEELGASGVDPAVTAVAKAYLKAEAAVRALEAQSTDYRALMEEPAYQKAEQAFNKASEAAWKLDRKLAGPFQKDCWINGRMTIHWKEDGQTRSQSTAFRSPLLIFPPDGLGAPGPVAGRFEAMLRDAGENYDLPINLSRIVSAGGVDRFVLTLGIPRSSKHEFSLELKTTEGDTLRSGPVHLEGLLPHSQLWLLENAAVSP